MTKKSLLLLVLWNVVLSALLGWMLLRKSTGANGDAPTTEEGSLTDTVAKATAMTTDTAALKDAHIAFFFMDSVRSQYELVEESASRVRSMGRQLEGDLSKEMQRAQARAQELASKDHTYSTQGELEADEKEFRGLEMRIADMRVRSQDRIDEMQMQMLQDITLEIQTYLEEYNGEKSFDFIFSIQEEGQIWVGNKGLDITADVVNGLNEKHRAKKAAAAKPAPAEKK